MTLRLAAASVLVAAGLLSCGIPIPGDDGGREPPPCERPELIDAVTAAPWTTTGELQVGDTLGDFFEEPTCIVSVRWEAGNDAHHRVVELGTAWRENGLDVQDADDHDVSRPAYDVLGDGYLVSVFPSAAAGGSVHVAVRVAMDRPVDVLAPILASVPPPSNGPTSSSTPEPPPATTSPSPPEPTREVSPPPPGAGTHSG